MKKHQSYERRVGGSKKGHKKHPRIGNLKWCFICHQYKDVNEFYLARTQPGGYTTECKSCRASYQRKNQHDYYLEHKDELLPKHRVSALKSYHKIK